MLSTRYAGFKGNDLGSERAGPWPSRTGDSSQVPRPSLSHTWVLRVRLLVGPAWVGVHRDRHGDSGWHALPSRVLGPRAARAAPRRMGFLSHCLELALDSENLARPTGPWGRLIPRRGGLGNEPGLRTWNWDSPLGSLAILYPQQTLPGRVISKPAYIKTGF